MSGLEGLVSIIYHEKQQPGSMLCAQHALNALLQGNYFTAPDLGQIATSLDTMESNVDEGNTGESTNMDDTGFFSVQVLEQALSVWGLSLVRWRSEAMQPYQNEPHKQMAFILNFQQHWFTLRRFGITDADQDTGQGHWFNLNSFLPEPEWVGKLYLGMVLQQAEQEGYSVFAVIQQDPQARSSLPRTEADDLAVHLPEPTSVSHRGARLTTAHNPNDIQAGSRRLEFEGLEDEDMELQAVLQASLMGGGNVSPALSAATRLPPPPPLPTSSYFPTGPVATGSSSATPPDSISPPTSMYSDETADPVAASMARNQAMLARMQQEQAAALREGYEDEAARIETLTRTRSAQRRATQGQHDEEDELQRAIRESQELARTEGHAPLDEDDDVDDDDYRPPESGVQPPPPLGPRSALYGNERVYDDDDAELQAALRASLEQGPHDFAVSESRTPSRPESAPQPPSQSEPSMASTDAHREAVDTDLDMSSEADTSMEAAPPPQLSMEEVRRRRLEKFGG